MTSWIQKLAVVAVLSLSIACGDSTSDNNADANNRSNNVNNTNNANNTNNVDNSDKAYASNYQLRFDSMEFDDDSPGKLVNVVLATNFDQTLEFPVVVLVDLQEIDVETGTMTIRGGSGLKTDTEGEYIWEEGGDTYSEGTLDAKSGEFSGVLPNLDFVATIVSETDTQKVVIPIQQLTVSGVLALNEDASNASIVAGRMEGYLTKVDGDATQISLIPGGEPIPLTNVFKESRLNYDTTTKSKVADGSGDAWFITAGFSAVPTIIR